MQMESWRICEFEKEWGEGKLTCDDGLELGDRRGLNWWIWRNRRVSRSTRRCEYGFCTFFLFFLNIIYSLSFISFHMFLDWVATCEPSLERQIYLCRMTDWGTGIGGKIDLILSMFSFDPLISLILWLNSIRFDSIQNILNLIYFFIFL